MLNLAIGENRLGDPPNISVSSDCAHLYLDRHGDLTVEKNSWRNVEINANIDKLKIHNRCARSSHKGRLKASGRDWHLGTDSDGCELSICGADPRVLNQLRIGAAGKELCNTVRDIERKVGAVDGLGIS